MVTISNTNHTSNIQLATIIAVLSKVKMLDICRKLDLYVSPNLKKDVTAVRVAQELLDNPTSILCTLCKNELQLLDEFIKAGPDQYITRKMRQTPYKLQKYGLVLTFEDLPAGEWKMLMPNSVRESLSTSYAFYLDCALKGVKAPTPKDLRMMDFLNSLSEE